MFKRHSKRGFTLVETVVCIFILVLLAVLVIDLLLNMTRSLYHFQANRRVAHTAEVVLGRLDREIKKAKSVDVFSSVIGSQPGKLVLNTKDESGNDTTIQFYLSGGALMVKEGNNTPATSTDATVAVSQLIFRTVGTSASEAVKIELILVDQGIANMAAVNFYRTAVLRGSY